MESILEFISFIEKNPVTGASILMLVVAGIIGIVKLIYNKISEHNKSPYVKSTYYGLSKNFYVTTVLEFFPDDNSSGYRQVQSSRPDLWKSKVKKVSRLGLIHKIIPINSDSILTVMVRKKGKEKMIHFNRIV